MVHHGGAGTTSAGLRAGNPTLVCPFFGDQHFWAAMVHRAGAGPKGCPIAQLTPARLVEAFTTLRSEEVQVRARELGVKMSLEDGVANGVRSFHSRLPLCSMLCEVSILNNRTSRLARFYCPQCGLKMSEEVDEVVHRRGLGREYHDRVPFRCGVWEHYAPPSVRKGLANGLGIATYQVTHIHTL